MRLDWCLRAEESDSKSNCKHKTSFLELFIRTFTGKNLYIFHHYQKAPNKFQNAKSIGTEVRLSKEKSLHIRVVCSGKWRAAGLSRTDQKQLQRRKHCWSTIGSLGVFLQLEAKLCACACTCSLIGSIDFLHVPYLIQSGLDAWHQMIKGEATRTHRTVYSCPFACMHVYFLR